MRCLLSYKPKYKYIHIKNNNKKRKENINIYLLKLHNITFDPPLGSSLKYLHITRFNFTLNVIFLKGIETFSYSLLSATFTYICGVERAIGCCGFTNQENLTFHPIPFNLHGASIIYHLAHNNVLYLYIFIYYELSHCRRYGYSASLY